MRWRTPTIGCLLPLVVAAAVLFGIAAIDGNFLAELAGRRRGGILAAASSFNFAGVNVPVALLALYLAFEAFRIGWRWADRWAISATETGLVPHRSLFHRPIRWEAVRTVRYVRFPRASALVIEFRDGRPLTIRGVDNEDGAAERFAELARARAAGK